MLWIRAKQKTVQFDLLPRVIASKAHPAPVAPPPITFVEILLLLEMLINWAKN